jgi:Asp-tRNA(Asn)/Glu-tRNA(Gln) amidotransferase C subunit
MRRSSMGYVKPTSAEDIDPATIEAIARLLELNVSPLETTTLAASVRDQLASIQSLEELDLTDIMPALEFDPRWES